MVIDSVVDYMEEAKLSNTTSATNRCLLNMGFLHQYAVTMDPSFPQTFSDSLQEKVSSQTTYGQDASEQLSLSFHLRSNQVGLTCGG